MAVNAHGVSHLFQLFEEYDESEIGALDHEDIDGRVEPSSQILDSVLDEFEKEQAKV